MNLFSHHEDNLLPLQGEAFYYGPILPSDKADNFFNSLLEKIAWRHDETVIFGKHIRTRRKVAWYADQAFEYTYSQTTKQALTWTEDLLALKQLVEKHSGETYNSCLLNLYHSGEEGMGWHSDDEKEMKQNGAIASLSLGAERKFVFRHKVTKEKTSVALEHGSLLVMKGETQSHWQHSLPKTVKVTTPRINLTFRTVVPV